jgi:Ni/Fe-hydrogenase subunit HybB-like protein
MSPEQPSTGTTVVLGLIALAGAVAFVIGVSQADSSRTWGIYLVNLVFWSSLAVTGPAIAGIMELMQARWSPTVKRLALTTSGFLPVSFVLFLILFGGLAVLYPWVTDPLPIKAAWLNVPFMTARIGLGVLALYAVCLAFTSAVFRESEGSPEDQRRGKSRRSALAVVMLILYVVVLSLFGFDLIMSLDPKWYSGLFGGYFVVSALYTGFALLAVMTVRGNATGLVAVPPAAVQDVAKLVFATSILWMYFFWSQYLVIWYGNVPVETRYVLRRFFEDPWRTLAFVVLIMGWLLPFSYLLKRLTGRPPERHGPLLFVSLLGLTAIFLERVLLVFPSISAENVFPLGMREVLITAGFFALFLLSRRRFLSKHGASLTPASP